MRLPVQAPAVVREAHHRPTAQLSRGLAPSAFSSSNVASITCAQELCSCGNGTYACCSTNQCNPNGSMCQCGSGGGP